MNSTFFAALSRRVAQTRSLLCVGIDPPVGADPLAFTTRMLEATLPHAAAYKFNSGFFEAKGEEGIRALKQGIAMVPNEVPVILDAKRGDIDSTAKAYAQAAFDTFGAGALTVNPYLGVDSLAPFLTYHNNAVFVLTRTSNAGAGWLQDIQDGTGRFVYEHVVSSLASNQVGFVVGATAINALARVRRLAPEAWILAPGVGAQGADLEAALAAGLRADGSGMLINVSRGISDAADPAASAAQYVERIRSAQASCRQKLAQMMMACGVVRFGSFKLKSGEMSSVYCDMRLVPSYPKLWAAVTDGLVASYNQMATDHIAGIPLGGVPLAAGLAMRTQTSLISPRREAKSYGTGKDIEGAFAAGQSVTLVDDVISTGASKVEMIERLGRAGLIVKRIMVVVDRRHEMEDLGVEVSSLLRLEDLASLSS